MCIFPHYCTNPLVVIMNHFFTKIHSVPGHNWFGLVTNEYLHRAQPAIPPLVTALMGLAHPPLIIHLLIFDDVAIAMNDPIRKMGNHCCPHLFWFLVGPSRLGGKKGELLWGKCKKKCGLVPV